MSALFFDHQRNIDLSNNKICLDKFKIKHTPTVEKIKFFNELNAKSAYGGSPNRHHPVKVNKVKPTLITILDGDSDD